MESVGPLRFELQEKVDLGWCQQLQLRIHVPTFPHRLNRILSVKPPTSNQTAKYGELGRLLPTAILKRTLGIGLAVQQGWNQTLYLLLNYSSNEIPTFFFIYSVHERQTYRI